MAIDRHFRLWQDKEVPIDILQIPYQHLKPQVHKAAARARTKAEWVREIRPKLDSAR